MIPPKRYIWIPLFVLLVILDSSISSSSSAGVESAARISKEDHAKALGYDNAMEGSTLNALVRAYTYLRTESTASDEQKVLAHYHVFFSDKNGVVRVRFAPRLDTTKPPPFADIYPGINLEILVRKEDSVIIKVIPLKRH